MLIYVQTCTGSDALKLTVESFDSITRIKQIIYRKEGTPPESQSLAFDGKELEDGRTINFYNISQGSTLRMIIPPPGPFPCQWIREITVGGLVVVKGPSKTIAKVETIGKLSKLEIIRSTLVPLDSSIVITFCSPDEAADPSETLVDVLGVEVRAFLPDIVTIRNHGILIPTTVVPLPPRQIGLCPKEPFLEDTVYEISVDATSSNGHFFRLRPGLRYRPTSYNLGNEGCSSFRKPGVWFFRTESSNSIDKVPTD